MATKKVNTPDNSDPTFFIIDESEAPPKPIKTGGVGKAKQIQNLYEERIKQVAEHGGIGKILTDEAGTNARSIKTRLKHAGNRTGFEIDSWTGPTDMQIADAVYFTAKYTGEIVERKKWRASRGETS